MDYYNIMRRPFFYNSLILDDSVVTYRNHGFTDICSLLFLILKEIDNAILNERLKYLQEENRDYRHGIVRKRIILYFNIIMNMTLCAC